MIDRQEMRALIRVMMLAAILRDGKELADLGAEEMRAYARSAAMDLKLALDTLAADESQVDSSDSRNCHDDERLR